MYLLDRIAATHTQDEDNDQLDVLPEVLYRRNHQFGNQLPRQQRSPGASSLKPSGYLVIVESGKAKADKILLPVLFRLNGRAEKPFEADTHHRGGFVDLNNISRPIWLSRQTLARTSLQWHAPSGRQELWTAMILTLDYLSTRIPRS